MSYAIQAMEPNSQRGVFCMRGAAPPISASIEHHEAARFS